MESISSLRQMMAEQKFSEVQKQIEFQLSQQVENRSELLHLLFNLHRAQRSEMHISYAVELAEEEVKLKNYIFVSEILNGLNNKKFRTQMTKLRLQVADARGQLNEIFQIVNRFLIAQLDGQVPFIPSWISSPIDKYFKDDLGIKLKLLAVAILVEDGERIERGLKDSLRFCMESVSIKGKLEKMKAMADVLKLRGAKDIFDVYQSFCTLYISGIANKSEYKRLVEMVIYFEEFPFQVFLLDLMKRLELNDEAKLYAKEIKSNPDYDFVYLEKYFPELKSYFIPAKKVEAAPEEEKFSFDLDVNDSYKPTIVDDERELDEIEEEKSLITLLKYQSYSTDQLCDIAVSFIQAEMFKAALSAAELSVHQASDEKSILKATYLKFSAQLFLKDFRAALDTALYALSISKETEDILSFLYAQAEAYIRLRQFQDARKVLEEIISIDSTYRMAQERLERLNEI